MKRLVEINTGGGVEFGRRGMSKNTQAAMLNLPEGFVVAIVGPEDDAVVLRPVEPGPYMLIPLDVWQRTLTRAVSKPEDVPVVEQPVLAMTTRQQRRAIAKGEN